MQRVRRKGNFALVLIPANLRLKKRNLFKMLTKPGSIFILKMLINSLLLDTILMQNRMWYSFH